MSSKPAHIKSLSTLVTLREKDVDRLSADAAAQQATRQRYQANLERLSTLCETEAPVNPHSGAHSPVQALNHANYKASVMQLADRHRQDLALHEADMALTQGALKDAACNQEVLLKVLAQQQSLLLKQRMAQEQKRQDDLAAQVWLRGQA